MVEEGNQEKKADAGKTMSTVLKVILGLIFLGLGVLAIYRWWVDLFTVIRGCIGLFMLLVGIITLAIAKE